MKKEFTATAAIIILFGIIILIAGVLVLGDIIPIDRWEFAKTSLGQLGPNSRIISGIAISLFGCFVLILGIKINK